MKRRRQQRVGERKKKKGGTESNGRREIFLVAIKKTINRASPPSRSIEAAIHDFSRPYNLLYDGDICSETQKGPNRTHQKAPSGMSSEGGNKSFAKARARAKKKRSRARPPSKKKNLFFQLWLGICRFKETFISPLFVA